MIMGNELEKCLLKPGPGATRAPFDNYKLSDINQNATKIKFFQNSLSVAVDKSRTLNIQIVDDSNEISHLLKLQHINYIQESWIVYRSKISYKMMHIHGIRSLILVILDDS